MPNPFESSIKIRQPSQKHTKTLVCIVLNQIYSLGGSTLNISWLSPFGKGVTVCTLHPIFLIF